MTLPRFTCIVQALEKKGWTKEDIAADLGVSQRTVYRWLETSSAATYLARRILYITQFQGGEHDPDNS